MRKIIDLIVPVFRAQDHIGVFLDSIFSWVEKADFDLRIHLFVDGDDQDTVREIEHASRTAMSDRVHVVSLERRLGQQAVILTALQRLTDRDSVVVICDDDIVLDREIFAQIVRPVVEGSSDMVVAQQQAKGLRTISSTFFWMAYRALMKKKVRGRDLMLRAISAELANRLSSASAVGFSVAIELDSLARNATRVRIPGLISLSRKSRYSAAERFRLFAELIIVSRKELGHGLIFLSFCGILGLPIVWFGLSIFEFIEPLSQGSILALLVALLGLINLAAIGANQVSIAMVVRDR